MNETIKNFLNSLNINFEIFDSLESSQIRSASDVNLIVSRFSFFKPRTEKLISIEDVVGYNYSYMGLDKGSIISNLSEFFDKDGDGYHRRSVSMLEIPSSQVMQTLESSFLREPVCVSEVDSGIYNISDNGLHRFHVIKMHYLNELSKINPQNAIARKNLREKYSFKAKVTEVDFIKTYSAFLLYNLDKTISIESHYENWELTGKVCLTVDFESDEKLVLSNEQLVEFVNEKMSKFLKTASKKEVKEFNEHLKLAYKNFDSFKKFYDKNIKQINKQENICK